MNSPNIEIPFGMRWEDLPFVDITYSRFSSAKADTGILLRISPISGVARSKIKSDGGKIEEHIGKVAPEALIPLLMLFESEIFFEMEDESADDPAAVVRKLSLSLPGRKKTVARSAIESNGLDILVGALKFTAGLSVPEALLADEG
jgi:hypothetical protein